LKRKSYLPPAAGGHRLVPGEKQEGDGVDEDGPPHVWNLLISFSNISFIQINTFSSLSFITGSDNSPDTFSSNIVHFVLQRLDVRHQHLAGIEFKTILTTRHTAQHGIDHIAHCTALHSSSPNLWPDEEIDPDIALHLQVRVLPQLGLLPLPLVHLRQTNPFSEFYKSDLLDCMLGVEGSRHLLLGFQL
jgi:hypothetical protein